MFATFEGRIQDGRLVVPELEGRSKILDGKHLVITPLELNEKREVIGGNVLAGLYRDGDLVDANGRKHTLNDLERHPFFVVVRHALIARVSGEVFDQKYQLGAKLGDMDD